MRLKVQQLCQLHCYIYFLTHRYPGPNYNTRITNSLSSLLTHNQISSGKSSNENLASLIQSRFLMATVGNEASGFQGTPISKFWLVFDR